MAVADLQARQISQSLRCLLQVLLRGGCGLEGTEVDNIPAAQISRARKDSEPECSIPTHLDAKAYVRNTWHVYI